MFKVFTAALVATGLLAGCATVTRGTKQKYAIASEPPGANVRLSTGEMCMTPCNLKLRRKDGFTATIEKAGYSVQTHQVASKVAGGGVGAATVGNFLLGGIIGAGVDATNGSMRTLYPTSIMATLVPSAPTPAPMSAPTLTGPIDAPAPAPAPPQTTPTDTANPLR